MKAFVLSGGGNRGPLQVGAIQALLEAGIHPDLVVGTSAGALNAAYLAYRWPNVNITELADLWHVRPGDIYPGSLASIAWRVLTGKDSLFPSDGMHRIVTGHLGETTFGDLALPCYITAVDLLTRRLYVFGDNPTDFVAPTVVASASVPGFHPPVQYRNMKLVDGGVAAIVPVSVAVEKGATEIWTVNVGYSGKPMWVGRGILNVLYATFESFLWHSFMADLATAKKYSNIDVYHIHISGFSKVAFNDFSHVDDMVKFGYKCTLEFLESPKAL